MEKRIVLDLETKNSFDEVGGRDHLQDLEVSLVGVYDYTQDAYHAYDERQFDQVEAVLKKADELIGFSIKQFDIPVLDPYLNISIRESVGVIDIMDDVERILGFRVSLDNISRATLGASKNGHGLDAIKWYREGKLDLLKKYCLNDVKLTKEIYDHGATHGYFLANLKNFNPLFTDGPLREEYAIPASWFRREEEASLQRLLERAVAKKHNIEIDYVSSMAHEGESFRKKRVIEAKEFLSKNSFKAFCFLRKDERVFKIPRILSAKIL